jgi:hypothetical protein
MTTVRIERQGTGMFAEARVLFPYNAHLVDLIRSVPGRYWNSDDRFWTIPVGEVNATARMFAGAGADVTVDGRPYTEHQTKEPPPRQPPPSGDEIDALFRRLPVQLRTPAFRALAKVLHPDIGGDPGLMRSLITAHEKHKEAS